MAKGIHRMVGSEDETKSPSKAGHDLPSSDDDFHKDLLTDEAIPIEFGFIFESADPKGGSVEAVKSGFSSEHSGVAELQQSACKKDRLLCPQIKCWEADDSAAMPHLLV